MAARKEQAGTRPRRSVRQWWVLLHRWVGLVLAGFLLLAGLTGSLLAWDKELDDWFAAEVMQDPAGKQPARFDAIALHDVIAAQYPHVRANYVELQKPEPGHTQLFFLLPTEAKYGPLENDQIFLSPVDGKVVGMRKYAAIGQGRKNLMPFIYTLHDQLALGTIGTKIFGIVALLWTLDCFVGAYLTFPLRVPQRSGATGKSWWARWKPSWAVRWSSGAYKLNMDLHRAGGLWVWAMLFVIAWSGVSFNLDQVYSPVMKSVLKFDEREKQLPHLAAQQPDPGIPWREAHRIAQTLMAQEAQRLGFAVQDEQMLSYDGFRGLYRYSVRSNADVSNYGNTHIYFDANTGALRLTVLPTGQYAGDTVTAWLEALHMAKVWGWPFRVFICAMGLIVAMLSVTGVVIWWKKRRARNHRDHKLNLINSVGA